MPDIKSKKNVRNRKELIDEVKTLIASKKLLKALRANVRMHQLLRDKTREIANQAQRKITRMFYKRYYKSLFKRRILIATIYLETNEAIVSPSSKV